MSKKNIIVWSLFLLFLFTGRPVIAQSQYAHPASVIKSTNSGNVQLDLDRLDSTNANTTAEILALQLNLDTHETFIQALKGNLDTHETWLNALGLNIGTHESAINARLTITAFTTHENLLTAHGLPSRAGNGAKYLYLSTDENTLMYSPLTMPDLSPYATRVYVNGTDENIVNNLLPLKSTKTTTDSLEVAFNKNVIQDSQTASSGKLSGGIFTYDGVGSLNYTTMEIAIKVKDSQEAELAYFTIPAGSKSLASLASNEVGILYMDYNNGSPQILITTDRTTIRTTDQFDLVRFYKNNSTVYIGTYGLQVFNFARREHERTSARGVAERMSGAIIAEKATRYVTIDASTWYGGTSYVTKTASDSQADGFEHYYSYNSATQTWTDNIATNPNQINNTQYNRISDGTLQTLTPNRYGVHWIYIGGGSKLSVVFGQGDYKSTEYGNTQPPAVLPPYLSKFSVLVGRIVIANGASTFTATDSAFDIHFNPAAITDHNDLANREVVGAHTGSAISKTGTALSDATTVQGALDSEETRVQAQAIYGFEESGKPTISYDASTLTLTIGANWCYSNGKRYYHAATTMAHPALYGVHYFYYDANGTLTTSQSLWNILATAQIAFVVYNPTKVSGAKGFMFNELHGMIMSAWTHLYNHILYGAKMSSVTTIADYSLQPASPSNAGNQFSISGGNLFDEDNMHIIPAFADGSSPPILWREGVSGNWTWLDAPTIPVLTGTTYIKYNQLTGGSWTTTEVSSDNYVNMWLCATGAETSNYKYFLILGQHNDTSLANAQARNFYDLALGTDFFAEVVPIQRITFRSRSTYTGSTGRCRIEGVTSLYGTSITLGNVISQAHNALAGRSDAGSHPASAISVSGTSEVVLGVTDAQSAFDTLAVAIQGGQAGEVWTKTALGYIWATIPAGVTDHLLLSNIGTLTHAQIDSAISALQANPGGITKIYGGIGDLIGVTGEVGIIAGTGITVARSGNTIEVLATSSGSGATVESVINELYSARSQGSAASGYYRIFDFTAENAVVVPNTQMITDNGIVKYKDTDYVLSTWDNSGTTCIRATMQYDVDETSTIAISYFETLPLTAVISANTVSTTNGWLQDVLNNIYTKAETDLTVEVKIGEATAEINIGSYSNTTQMNSAIASAIAAATAECQAKTWTPLSMANADYTGEVIVDTMAASATVGQCLYLASGGWTIADADASTTMPALGLCIETGTGDRKILMKGCVRNTSWSFTKGQLIYVSQTAGAITATAPTASTTQRQKIGIALSATVVYFFFDATLVEN